MSTPNDNNEDFEWFNPVFQAANNAPTSIESTIADPGVASMRTGSGSLQGSPGSDLQGSPGSDIAIPVKSTPGLTHLQEPNLREGGAAQSSTVSTIADPRDASAISSSGSLQGSTGSDVAIQGGAGSSSQSQAVKRYSSTDSFVAKRGRRQ